jgi:hypothetical protein
MQGLLRTVDIVEQPQAEILRPQIKVLEQLIT